MFRVVECGATLSDACHYGGVKLISVKLPNGKEPKWDDAMMLNIGVGVLPEFEVLATDQEWLVPEDQPFASIIHMTVLFHFSKGRYVAKFVGLEAHPEVTGTDLREVRVAEVLRLASTAGIYARFDKEDDPVPIREGWGEDVLIAPESPMMERIKRTGPKGWVLEWIALAYNIAQISSQPPAKAVEKAFGLSSRTAARWIAKAREQGVLKRPAVPGWEHLTEMEDRISDQLAKGDLEGLVVGVTPLGLEDMITMPSEDDDGEHSEASER